MKSHQKLGFKGEKIATGFLIKKGFTILQLNYRFKHSEIDIIAKKKDLLVFVEVKTRSGRQFGLPEEAVNHKKTSSIFKAAENFILHIGWEQNIRFDVISISINETLEITHIEDAFY
jgi:putative endonuclease